MIKILFYKVKSDEKKWLEKKMHKANNINENILKLKEIK